MSSLGGVLSQLLMPLIYAATFLIKELNVFSASFIVWWFGENFVDLAPYIQDASIGDLPLLGGNTGKHSPYGFHDFEYLLIEMGLISYNQGIALASYLLGCMFMILSLGWGSLML